VKTVTIIPTETGNAAGDHQGSISDQGSGLKTGAIVGIVVGIVGGILALAGLAIFVYYRRKKQQQESDYRDDPSIRGSSSGMMGTSRPEMAHTPGSPGSTGNRSSTLQVDPRMDPFQQTLYARTGSRESVNTLRDDHDYSRRIQQPKVLRATNPDP
jgi:cell wall integrity and stress response component